MKDIKVKVAANITYSGSTFNTVLLLEYCHTGKQWFYKKKASKSETFTESPEIAAEKMAKGLKVTEKQGYYFIKRIAIPTVNASGEKDIWYIDKYVVNKVSKFGRKVHKALSENNFT